MTDPRIKIPPRNGAVMRTCPVCGDTDFLEQCSNCGVTLCECCMSGHGCDPDIGLCGPLNDGLFGYRYLETR